MAGIQSVKRRPVAAKAVEFDGKNGAEVVAFVRAAEEQARNGGSYVSVTTDSSSFRLRKGDFVVLDADGSIQGYSAESFARFFSTGKR